MEELAELVEAVQRSAKYRNVCADVIRGVGARELAKGQGLWAAVKATKKKLHQVGAAYLTGRLPYAQWLERLEVARISGAPNELHRVCREALGHHSSTRERLPILERFFRDTLGALAPISSVLDIACGLNPLAIPWMPLAPGARYYGCDMYIDMVQFLNAAMFNLGVQGEIKACDVTESLPPVKADVALILKSLPCIEQLDRSCSARLLREVPSNVLLVSYPVRSLGGRSKGMCENYEEQFWKLIEGEGWAVRRFVFESELAFVVTKNRT
jgi:16S rRNA (guanine(1405)-N(7))-methyltransferase